MLALKNPSSTRGTQRYSRHSASELDRVVEGKKAV